MAGIHHLHDGAGSIRFMRSQDSIQPPLDPVRDEVSSTGPVLDTPQAAATDSAVRDQQAAERSLSSMRDLLRQGHGFARPELDSGYLQQNVADTRTGTEAAIAAEVQAIQAASPGVSAEQAIGQIRERYADSPELLAIVDEAAPGVLVTVEADAALEDIDFDQEPVAALQDIDAAMAQVSPQARAAMLEDPRVQAVVEAAAEQATAPLQPYLDSGEHDADIFAAATDSLQSLEQTVAGLDPELAAAVVEQALPDLEQAHGTLPGASLLMDRPNLDGPHVQIARLASHVSGSSSGGELTARMIGLNRDETHGDMGGWFGAVQSITLNRGWSGETPVVGPALFVELARAGVPIDPIGEPGIAHATDAISNGLRWPIQPAAAEYYELVETLQYAQQMYPLFESDAEYVAAVDELMTETLGADWQARIQAKEAELAEHGTGLLMQLSQLSALPADHPQRAEADAFIASVLNDPAAQIVIGIALQQDPSLAEGPIGEALLDVFSVPGLEPGAQAIAAEYANLYIAVQTGDAIGGLDGSDPATIAAADARIAALDDPRLAAALGVESEQLTGAITELRQSLPGLASDDPATRESAQRSLNNALNAIPGFTLDDPAGQILRGVALAATGSAMVNSQGLNFDDPRLESLLDIAIGNLKFGSGANFTAKSLLAASVNGGLLSGKSLPGSYGMAPGNIAGRLLAGVGVLVNGWNAINAFSEGDTAVGALHVTTIAGTAAGIFGAGSWLGPVGWAAAAVSVVGLGIIENTRHNNRFETQDMQDFLAASGLSDDAAAVLYDTTGNAVSPVPFLLHYAAAHGLSPQETVSWLNQLAADGQLGSVVGLAHRAIDASGGDGTGIPATHLTDAEVAEHYLPHAVVLSDAESLAQMDMKLEVLGIPLPQP